MIQADNPVQVRMQLSMNKLCIISLNNKYNFKKDKN